MGATVSLGKVARSRGTWARTLAALAVGGLLSGTVVGAGLGLVGALIPAPRPELLAAAMVACAWLAGMTAGLLPGRVPTSRRQTHMRWGKYLPETLGAAVWGFEIGAAFATWMTFTGVWPVAVVVAALGSPAVGALLFAGYWLGRLLPNISLAVLDSREGLAIVEHITQAKGWYRRLHAAGTLLMVAALALLLRLA